MSKFQRYVLKEVLKALVPAFLALMLIMVLGSCVQLLHEGLDVTRLRGLPRHIASISIPWVLPPAFLTAVIIAFGRLSADNEIVAMQCGGVHLFHVMMPVYALGVLLSGLAAYSHFNTVPLASLRIEMLRYEALKQILLDRVALSAQRQFSIYPCTIRYEDYRDGRMIDVLIVDTSAGLPRTIIIAGEGTIRPDPERSEFVLTLRDCALTRLGGGELGGPLKAPQVTLSLVAPDPGDISAELEHLPVKGLLRRLEELEGEVSKHPRLLVNPGEAGRQARHHIENLNAQRAGLQEDLDDELQKLRRLREDKRRVHEHTIEQKREELRFAKERRKTLITERASCLTEIEKLQEESGDEGADYDRIAELQKSVRETTSKLEALRVQSEEAEAKIEDEAREIHRDKRKAEEIQQEADVLREELEALDKRREKSKELRRMAAAQKDLREVKVRIHKRLALATAVLVFATIGIPLGIMTHRRSSIVGFGIGFAIMLLVFYPLLITGQIAAKAGLLAVAPAMWGGNAITLFIGLLMTAAVMRK